MDFIGPEFDKKIKTINIYDSMLVMDFDSTMTHFYDIFGKELHSIDSLIRESPHIFPLAYIENSYQNYKKFSPYESDMTLSVDQRNMYLNRWYISQQENFIKNDITFLMLQILGESHRLRMRKWLKETIELFQKHNLSIYIISAGGVGKEMIPIFLKKHNIKLDNINIISNGYTWDKKGKILFGDIDIVHIYNKNIYLKKYISDNHIKKVKNCILVGDSLGDPSMVLDEDFDTVVRFGFFHKKDEELLEFYKKIYDFVIMEDSNFEKIYTTISTLFQK